MKVCFVQREPFAYFGIMALSGYLKVHGILVETLISTMEKDIIRAVGDLRPDIIGISVMTPEHGWMEAISHQLKKAFPSIPIIVGGVHAILYPKDILAIPSVDYVCSGEGERTLTALCRAIETYALDPGAIQGLGYRKSGAPSLNEREPLLESVSGWFEDREPYYTRYAELRQDALKQFTASRGCPYTCSFCFNEQLMDIFRGRGKYIRIKEPDHFIEEIKRTRESSGMESIFFADDLFTLNKAWLMKFLPLYRKEIGLPFMCTTRANLMSDEIALGLSEAGCHTVSFGIETGSQRIRNEVLKKGVSDEDIVRCASILKKHGIRIQTSNMFCLPDETFDDALSTVRLNIAVKTDFAFSTLFMPFPGTALAKYCVEKGYLKESLGFRDIPLSFLSHSILDLPDKDRIENLQKCSYFVIKYPWLFPVIKRVLAVVRAQWIFYPLIFLGSFLRYKDERKISFISAVTFLWRFRKSW